MKLSFVLLAALLVGVCEVSSSDSSGENDYSCILTVSRIHGDAISSKVMLKEAKCHDDLQELKSQVDQMTPNTNVHSNHAYKDIEEDGRIMFEVKASELDALPVEDFGTKIVAADDVDGCFDCITSVYASLGGTKKTCTPLDCPAKLDGIYVNSPLPVTKNKLFNKCIMEDSDDGSFVKYCKDFTPKL